MRLYKIESPAHTFEDGREAKHTVAWAGNQTDARHARMGLESQFKDIKPAKRPRVTVDEVDVPTDKIGLLEFLNGL